MHAAHQLIDFQPGHQRQSQLGPHAIEPDQLPEQFALALLGEAVEKMCILADDQMRVQGHRLAQRRQAVEGGHRDLQLVSDAVHIENQVRRLFFRQGATQTSNHR
ncbi:hypothetical protein D3C81_1354370 [compost metagenome]